MNELPHPKRVEIKRLLAAGNSIRVIARTVGCVTNTVRRYAEMYQMKATCPCGQDAGHQGWCAYRIAFSPNRRGFLCDQWERRGETNLSRLADEAHARAKEKGHRLGSFVWGSRDSAAIAWALCQTCGKMVRINHGPHAITFGEDSVFVGRERLDGNVLVDPCLTPKQKAAMKAASQEKRTWHAAKRTLRAIRANLRASRSPTTASAPPPTSCE